MIKKTNTLPLSMLVTDVALIQDVSINISDFYDVMMGSANGAVVALKVYRDLRNVSALNKPEVRIASSGRIFLRVFRAYCVRLYCGDLSNMTISVLSMESASNHSPLLEL